jgi:hypothetical protein
MATSEKCHTTAAPVESAIAIEYFDENHPLMISKGRFRVEAQTARELPKHCGIHRRSIYAVRYIDWLQST